MSTAEHARNARFEAVARRRLDEARCAWDFLYHGEPHDDCIFPARGEPRCSREYDPGAPPDDEKLYEGTALAALWGDPTFAWQLAGWNITRRRRSTS